MTTEYSGSQHHLTSCKAELKDFKVLNEQLSDENRAMKELQREADGEAKRLKSDCAETLMNKERLTQQRQAQLESDLSDQQITSQKLMTKVAELERSAEHKASEAAHEMENLRREY